MQPPTVAGFAAVFLLLVPQAQAQESRADSGTGGWVASFGVAPLRAPRHPALAPGGRLGPATTPSLVAARWGEETRARLPPPRIGLAATAEDSAARAIAAARAALPPPTRTTVSPFGPYADLGLQLNLRMELKADQFKNHRCGLLDQQTALSGCNPGLPTITPNPQYAIRAAGVVGRRLHINVDFDSQREFDANNNLQVWYEGLEDEVLRRVEAGNVTFQAASSRFISAAIPANNFGVQAIGQVGPLEMRGIYAQQKGNVIRDRIYSVGEATTQPLDREARDLDYAAGRFFFVVDPTALPGYPAVDILAVDPLTLPDSVRVGSLRIYRVRVATPGGQGNQNVGGVRAVACAPSADAAGCSAERAGPFQWEVLIEGRDYYVDPSGAWFALSSPLNQDDHLAVSYVPAGQTACDAPLPCIGTFPIATDPDPSVVDTLRLVYDPKTGITADAPSFRFEIRNAYRVGGSELTRESVDLALMVNQRERTVTTGETYLAVVGLAVPNDQNRFDQYNRLFPRTRDPQQGAPLRDYFIVFPHLTPLADSTRLSAAERNDSLYRTPRNLLVTQAPPSVFTLRLRASVNASADRAVLSLNSFEIREASEKIYLGNRLLQRGSDYTIDYSTGQVQFLRPDSLFQGGLSQVRAQFEERAAFAVAPTAIYGVAGRYDLGDHGSVNVTGLFQNERSTFTRPPLGFEPSSSFIGGISTDLQFRPEWVTRALNALPLLRTEAPSFMNVAAEVAVSKPSPNRFGQAYIEEFEGEAARFIPLAEPVWRWGSRPSSPRGAEPYGISILGFDTVNAAALTWQNLPVNPNGSLVQFLPQQIDPSIRVTGQAVNAEPVLWLMLKPDTVLGLAHPVTGSPNWVRPPQAAPRWRSITQSFATGGADLSRVEFLEFWVWEDARRTARDNGAALLFDIGSVFEDAVAWVPDSFTVTGADTTWMGQRFVGRGTLQTERDSVTHSWNAAEDDIGILSDLVVDSIRNATTGVTIDTLPLCNATINNQIVAYGFGDLRSRCGRRNGAVDTEDQDGDFVLDSAAGVRTAEDFVRFVFPIGDERYFVRDGGTVGGATWRLYRIPFRTDTLLIGTPNLRQTQAIRLTIVAPPSVGFGPDSQIYFGVSRMRLVGSTWLKRGTTPLSGLAGDRGTFTGSVVASVVSTENTDLGYTPPPGVSDQASRQDAGLQVGSQQINERSLRLLATGLDTGERAEAFLRFTAEGDKNFLRYRTLRAWARGRGPGWEDGDLQFFIKAGKDPFNFYLYEIPARTVTWEPEVVVDLQRWLVLRAEIEQAWLSGAAPQVGPGCPDSTFLLAGDSAFVRCDGPYIVHVRDPATAPPNLAQVQEIAVGMVRVGQRVFIDQAELWVDDIRLGDVVEDAGMAGALDVALTAGDVADFALSASRRDGQFRQLGEDPSYVTDDVLSAFGTLRLERFLPQRWGLAVPLSARFARTASDPFYLNRTDIRADVLDGLRETASWAQTFGLSVRRVRRSGSGPARWLLDPASVSASYTRGRTSSSFATATARAYGVNFDYVLAPPIGAVTIAGRRVRFSPTSVSFRSTLARSDAERATFQVPVERPADSAVVAVPSTAHTWRNAAAIDLLPMTGLQLRMDVAQMRDLRDYGDSTTMGLLLGQEQATLLGVDVGFESQRAINTFLGVNPLITPWLRPRATLTSRFGLNRDPNARTPVRAEGDTAGAFRVPTALASMRQADLGAQLDVRMLSRRLLGDSGVVQSVMGILQPFDVAFSRTLSSVFGQTGVTPSAVYQLALGGLDQFRFQDGVPATSAADNTGLTVRGGATLPLNFRVGADYQRTRGESWLLRGGTQVPLRTNSTTWPSGNVSWSVSPRRFIGRFLASLTTQATYREFRSKTEQPVLGGAGGSSLSSTFDRALTPSLALAWAGGVLTNFDGSVTRGEQVQAGNLFQSRRGQYGASLTFSFRPGFIETGSPVRTTARYQFSKNRTCIQTAGQVDCRTYVDSRQTSAQLTMDTDFQSNLGAGLQVAYVLNEERQANRKTSQLVITAFVSFVTSVGNLQ